MEIVQRRRSNFSLWRLYLLFLSYMFIQIIYPVNTYLSEIHETCKIRGIPNQAENDLVPWIRVRLVAM